MKLTEKQAKRLQEMFKNDPDFCNISEEIEEALEIKEMEIGQVIMTKHCKHEWEFPSAAEIRRIGSPKMYGLKDSDDNAIKEFYMTMGGKCKNCGINYRYKDVSMDEVKNRLNDEFGISIHVGPSIHHRNIINDIYEEKCMQTKENVEVMEKEIAKLEKEIEDKRKGEMAS